MTVTRFLERVTRCSEWLGSAPVLRWVAGVGLVLGVVLNRTFPTAVTLTSVGVLVGAAGLVSGLLWLAGHLLGRRARRLDESAG